MSFEDLMGVTIRAETDTKRQEDENKNKRPLAGQSSKIQQVQVAKSAKWAIQRTRPTYQQRKPCTTCHVVHVGECHVISGEFFNYEKFGHRVTDSPELLTIKRHFLLWPN